MVEFEITDNPIKQKHKEEHDVEEPYDTLLIHLSEDDSHFMNSEQIEGHQYNWMPEDDEIREIVRKQYFLSYDFKVLIHQAFGINEDTSGVIFDGTKKDIPDLVEEEFENDREKVEYALKKHRKCRNDDQFLVWYIHKFIDEADLNCYQELVEATNREDIINHRTDIQQNGKYLPTSVEVLDKRSKDLEIALEHFQDEGDEEMVQKIKEYMED
jgi:hypothetical protein